MSPQSPLDAFDIDSEDFPNTFYIYRVTYFLNLIFPANKKDLFTEILDPSYYCPENADEAVILWKEIAVAECIEYLQYQLDKVNFEFTPGEKTYKTFDIKRLKPLCCIQIMQKRANFSNNRYLSPSY